MCKKKKSNGSSVNSTEMMVKDWTWAGSALEWSSLRSSNPTMREQKEGSRAVFLLPLTAVTETEDKKNY